MALNKKFKDIQKLYDVLGWNNANTLNNGVAKSPDYMYIAFLSQGGGDPPIANVLLNDFLVETDIRISYEGLGVYRLSNPLIAVGKTMVELGDSSWASPEFARSFATVYDGYVEIQCFLSLAAADDILGNTPIKISVWNNTDIALTPPAPVAPFGYRYALVNDTTCMAFSTGACDWTASGGLLSTAFSWGMEMTAFYPDGNAILIDNQIAGCVGIASTYLLKTIGTVDPGVITLTDANCNPAPNITWNLITGPLKNYSGIIPAGPSGSNAWSRVDLPGDGINLGSASILVDISDPIALAAYLQYIFQNINNSTCTVTATDMGGGNWQLDVNQIYSNSTSIELNTFIPVVTPYILYLVP